MLISDSLLYFRQEECELVCVSLANPTPLGLELVEFASCKMVNTLDKKKESIWTVSLQNIWKNAEAFFFPLSAHNSY